MPHISYLQMLRTAAAAAALALAGSAAAQNTVAITEYVNDTNGTAALGEWVELYNYGAAPVTITGWKLKDDDSSGVTLPAATIAAKEFLVVARDKSAFETMWLKGIASAKVIQWPSGFALSDTGADELVLNTGSNVLVWRIAYGANSHSGSSTWYAGTDFSVNNHGTKASVINRNGNDALTGALGYEGQEFTPDSHAYSGAGDVGSPLRGHYPGAINPPAQPTSWTVDLTAEGAELSSGVRGIAIADQSLNRGDNSDQTGILPFVDTARGGSLRGVSGGLNADLYDWKTRNAQPRPTTLQFLRWARDSSCTLYITANIRGLTVPDETSPTTHRMYYTSDTATLAQMAGDWVRYTNRIVQTYREGDTITDVRDAAILDSLTWNSSYVSPWGSADNYTTLPAVGEAPIPPVKYWEIGNEPLISLANAYSVTNAFTFSGSAGHSTHQDYVDRYIALTTAMVAEDPTIKVGPCIVNARSGANANILALLLQSAARIDFIAYHPYGSMDRTLDLYPNAAHWQQAYLSGVYSEQALFLQDIKDLVATHRPADVDTMEYAATETNVSDFRTNNQFQEATMAHALGSAESVLSWARLGLKAAHYWIWITAGSYQISDWNRYPVTMAFEKMRDRLGDRFLGAFDAHDNVRMYLVRDSETGEFQVWAMNFSDSTDIAVTLSLTNAGSIANTTIRKQVLQAITGATNLFSANLPPEQNLGTPRRDVDWSAETELAGADPANLNVTLPAATLTLLTIDTVLPTAAGDWSLYE